MTVATETKSSDSIYASAFSRLIDDPGNDQTAWLREFRENSFRRFQEVGFPSVNDEEWKYTNVAAISKGNFAPVVQVNGTSVTRELLQPWTYEEAPVQLTFVNGLFRSDLSITDALPPTVKAIDLKDAADDPEFAATIRESFERQGDAVNGFVALNNALFAGGLFLKLERNAFVETPIQLLFVTEPLPGGEPAASPRVLIHADANSSATIIESYGTTGDTP